MITILNNIPEYKLIDVENTQITLSAASLKLNEAQPVSNPRRSLHTVAEMESGKFRRRFDRHRTAFRFFN
jgi:hypothetical protein